MRFNKKSPRFKWSKCTYDIVGHKKVCFSFYTPFLKSVFQGIENRKNSFQDCDDKDLVLVSIAESGISENQIGIKRNET